MMRMNLSITVLHLEVNNLNNEFTYDERRERDFT